MWLLRQAERDDSVGDLARGYEHDRRAHDAVGERLVHLTHNHLDKHNADPAVHDALEQARVEWIRLLKGRSRVTSRDNPYRTRKHSKLISVLLPPDPEAVSVRYVTTYDAERIVVVLPRSLRDALDRLVTLDPIQDGTYARYLATDIRAGLEAAYQIRVLRRGSGTFALPSSAERQRINEVLAARADAVWNGTRQSRR
jgi:hypothetical protein